MNKKERDHQYIAYMCQVVQIKMLMIVMIIVVEKCVVQISLAGVHCALAAFS